MLRIFNVKQGDTFSFTITFKNLTDDLTSFDMGIKLNYSDEEFLLSKSLNDGITKIDDGKYRVDFTADETASLEPNFYLYDLRMSIESTVFTPLYGYLNIQETVFE